MQPARRSALQPRICYACTQSRIGRFGLSPFARRYSGSRGFFLFLRLLRCFSSPAYLPYPMCSGTDDWALPQPGFPIRKSAGRRLFSASPQLIAAVHVLHRLLVPRHPPCALIILTEEHHTFATMQISRCARSSAPLRKTEPEARSLKTEQREATLHQSASRCQVDILPGVFDRLVERPVQAQTTSLS